MSFGWSASDIAHLIVLCHSVAENCRGGVRSASVSLSGLRKAVLELRDVLGRLERVSDDSDLLRHIDFEGIDETLRQCDDHLKKNDSLVSDKGNVFRRGHAIARHLAWGEKDVCAMEDMIFRHKQSIILHLSLLERCYYSLPTPI
jgi:hypothetical protein